MDDRKPVALEPAPVLTAEHELLNVFLGRWKVEGQNKAAAPVAPNTPVVGEESYEWLPGRFFIVYYWNRHFGENAHLGIGTIGYDPVKHTYTMQNYDNMGYARTYTGGLNNGIWLFTGDNERVTIAFEGDGTMKAKWDILSDDSDWLPLCELTETKIK